MTQQSSIEETIAWAKSQGIDLRTEVARLRYEKTELLEALKGLNKQQSPEKYGYCFCGVAAGNPNYKGIHFSSCDAACDIITKVDIRSNTIT